MKIAFVAYPIAALLPPFHGSMGASIYSIARNFARHSEVVVYSLADFQAGARGGVYEGAEYRFLPAESADVRRHRARRLTARLVQLSEPLSTSSSFYPGFGERVAADLAREPWDVIHVQHCSQFVPVIRQANPKAKIVLHIHAEWFSQSNLPQIARRIRELDVLLTVSDFVTSKTQRSFPFIARRCGTLHNGIDMHEFDHDKDYAEAAKRKQKRILYAGGIWPHKGVHIAIDAFQLVAEKYPNVRMDLVGPQGNYPLEEACDLTDTETLARMAHFFRKQPLSVLTSRLLGNPARKSNEYLEFLNDKLSPELARRVTFHGFVSRGDLVQLYYNADVFIYPPIWNEAFGCTPLEAMAAGVPVVVSRAGGIVETVQDQETGFIVEPDNAQCAADAMLRLLNDSALREKMGRAGRKRALQFAWDTITKDMYARYQAIADANPQQPQCAPGSVEWMQPVSH